MIRPARSWLRCGMCEWKVGRFAASASMLMDIRNCHIVTMHVDELHKLEKPPEQVRALW